MRVLVCGGRSYGTFGNASYNSPDYARAFKERGIMCRALDKVVSDGARVFLHGGAHGADTYVKNYAETYNILYEKFDADWHNADEGKPDLVLAFPGGKGTADMVARARKAGIEVRKIA